MSWPSLTSVCYIHWVAKLDDGLSINITSENNSLAMAFKDRLVLHLIGSQASKAMPLVKNKIQTHAMI